MDNSSLNTRFICIEGVDGAGKTTHVNSLVEQLRSLGHEVIHTREPGGTPLAEQLRPLLLNHPMSPETETMLMYTARKDHIDTVIRPALERGVFVVCDRFTDSSWAYQVGGKNVSPDLLEQLESMTLNGIKPGMTLLFDLPVEISLERLKKTDKTPDKFESESPDFFRRVRQAYHERVKLNPSIKIVNSAETIEQIAAHVKQHVNQYLNQHVKELSASAPKKRMGPGA